MSKKNTSTSTSAKSRTKKSLQGLGLGSSETQYQDQYNPKLLESFDNKNPSKEAFTTFLCTEFTSLCPKTNQPDFARITINYIADKKMVESKSLKLYLFSFRNHGDFHEDCIQIICDDLVSLIKPHFIEVIGEFTPRGGIAIYPYASYSSAKKRFKDIRDDRLKNYSPGKFSGDFSRIY